MTDDEIVDECRKGYAAILLDMNQIMAAGYFWYQTDSGDETSPSERNPQPIEDVYVKLESEEEKRERMWRAVQEFS